MSVSIIASPTCVWPAYRAGLEGRDGGPLTWSLRGLSPPRERAWILRVVGAAFVLRSREHAGGGTGVYSGLWREWLSACGSVIEHAYERCAESQPEDSLLDMHPRELWLRVSWSNPKRIRFSPPVSIRLALRPLSGWPAGLSCGQIECTPSPLAGCGIPIGQKIPNRRFPINRRVLRCEWKEKPVWGVPGVEKSQGLSATICVVSPWSHGLRVDSGNSGTQVVTAALV